MAANPPRRPASAAAFPSLLAPLLAFSLAVAPPAPAATDLDLSRRIVIDGLTDESAEWEPDESLFQINDTDIALPVPEESVSDSKWGFNNDLNQIRVTWDARFLYVAVNGIIWGNNVIWLVDLEPGGMSGMTNLNSWRRNFTFQGIQPDLFLATWDTNTQPQVWRVNKSPGSSVITSSVSQVPSTAFTTVATFSQGAQGRAMEAAIPWEFVLGEEAEQFFSAEYGDSVYALPDYITDLRIVGVVTAGADGTGGPDSAPDNLTGHEVDGAQQVTIDNWATIPLDLLGPDGAEGPDGVVDFGVDIRERLAFRIRPPVLGVRQEITEIVVEKPVISPEQGGQLRFEVRLQPEIPPTEAFRTVTLTAEIRNLAGELMKRLYTSDVRQQVDLVGNPLDRWNCRDLNGAVVPGGIYLLRVVLEPDSDRKVKAFSVVR